MRRVDPPAWDNTLPPRVAPPGESARPVVALCSCLLRVTARSDEPFDHMVKGEHARTAGQHEQENGPPHQMVIERVRIHEDLDYEDHAEQRQRRESRAESQE